MKHLKTYESFTIDIIESDFEYQYRDIDVGSWYKREKGIEIWSFTSEYDFDRNANEKNTIKWIESK
jgi:hypothetical protein